MKRFYRTPAVLRQVAVELEQNLLAGSVVTKKTTIETAGQKVENKDFSESGFNSTWE